ncbi:hypothetical protein D1AOALGA4SA_3111 [Olavius algarvensis Delta 1 endosymbiont]|nr:hypothetical protein D1AOALGA4SA_3111 [Olavius algarvensis Delta 1 endosymbiont]
MLDIKRRFSFKTYPASRIENPVSIARYDDQLGRRVIDYFILTHVS